MSAEGLNPGFTRDVCVIPCRFNFVTVDKNVFKRLEGGERMKDKKLG